MSKWRLWRTRIPESPDGPKCVQCGKPAICYVGASGLAVPVDERGDSTMGRFLDAACERHARGRTRVPLKTK